MKKRFCLIPLLLCLFLCGCANASQTRFEAFSQELAQKKSVAFTAHLHAIYPNRDADFDLRYEQADGVEQITVLSPGRISGITAYVERGQSSLHYDGMILDTGDLDANGLTPMSSLPLLMDALQNAHGDAYWEEDGCSAVKLLYSDNCSVQVWFNADYIPCRAEIYSDNNLTVSCEIENWS
jgi:hypothetical protein